MASLREDQILKRAQDLREKEHRLQPSLRLRTIDEIQEFVHAKGLVSVLGGNELPSVISAILGREWKPSRKGFTSWEEWWSIKISGQNAGHALGQLDRAKDIISTRIFRNSKTLVSQSLWPILNPIVKRHLDLAVKHKILSGLEWKILKVLDDNGPTRTDHLRSRLKLQGKTHTSRFHRALSKLENYALILGYEDPHPERHLHANIWQPWTMRVSPGVKGKPRLAYGDAVMELFAKTLDAAILAPEKEVEKWFQWEGGLSEAKKQLLDSGKILQVGNFIVTARVA